MMRRVVGLTMALIVAGATTVLAAQQATHETAEKSGTNAAASPKPSSAGGGATAGWSGWGRMAGTVPSDGGKATRLPARENASAKLAPTRSTEETPAAPAAPKHTSEADHRAPVAPNHAGASAQGALAHAIPKAAVRWSAAPHDGSPHSSTPAWLRLIWTSTDATAVAHKDEAASTGGPPPVRVYWEEDDVVPERPAVTPSPAPASAPPPPPAEGPAMAPARTKMAAAMGVANRQSSGFQRWIGLSTAMLSARYRTVTNSRDVRTVNQLQDQQAFKVRLKLDAAGHYSLNVGAFTGDAFIAGWNNTGVGTGDLARTLSVKQLYFDAVPAPGVDLQYGSLYIARGENTEITSYDNDGYVTGMRASVKRPKALFFDEIAATQGYLGDPAAPSVFDRAGRLAESNYWQGLVAKRLGARVTTSADVTRVSHVDTVRAAVTVKPKDHQPVDLIRVESYRRLGHGVAPAAGGFALYGERSLARRVAAGGGWADIDLLYNGLNADRFNKGRRLFATGTVTISPELSVQAFYTRAAENRAVLANKTRLDVILTYNLLRTLQRTGRF